jgi:hypothetical protein
MSRGANLSFVLALALALAAATVLHAPHLGAPFFADDYLFLEQVRGRSLVGALVAPDPLGNFLRPVSRAAYFWGVAAVAGEASPAFRAVNLLLLLGALGIFAWIARRLAGAPAATFAVGYLAIHYAADVPALWVSGAQDLLALFFALAAIALHASGRALPAAGALLLALLSKESVAGTALVAALAARAPGEGWGRALRRATPLFATTAAWAVVWILFAVRQGGHGLGLAPSPADGPAAFVHLARVVAGLEFRQSGPVWLADPVRAAVPIALAAVAVVIAALRRQGDGAGSNPSARHPSRGGAAITGLVWALVGTLPVVAVATIWSAYFYLFALCGAALVLGVALTGARRPAWLAPAVLVVVGALFANARALDEFALGSERWSPHSHVNRFYLDRGMEKVARYLGDLRGARPAVPPRSTIFFANLPSAVAFQTADGPLVRWAYADTSLRSYFLRDYSVAKATRGPVFVFAVEDDRLVDKTDEPDLFQSVGYSMLVQEQLAGAVEALTAALTRDPGSAQARYLLAWAYIARGERESGKRLLEALGLRQLDVPPVDSRHQAALAAGDSAAAVASLQRTLSTHVLDGPLHGALSSVLLQRPATVAEGVIEAFAYRALAPEDPLAWRLWAGAQLQLQHTEAGALSLDRYFALGGAEAAADDAARRVREELRRYAPGGDLVQESLRR